MRIFLIALLAAISYAQTEEKKTGGTIAEASIGNTSTTTTTTLKPTLKPSTPKPTLKPSTPKPTTPKPTLKPTTPQPSLEPSTAPTITPTVYFLMFVDEDVPKFAERQEILQDHCSQQKEVLCKGIHVPRAILESIPKAPPRKWLLAKYLWIDVIQPNCKKEKRRCFEKPKYKDVGKAGKDDDGKLRCVPPNVEANVCKDFYENENRVVLYLLENARKGTGLVGEWSDKDFSDGLKDLKKVLEKVSEKFILITSGHYTAYVMSRVAKLGMGALTTTVGISSKPPIGVRALPSYQQDIYAQSSSKEQKFFNRPHNWGDPALDFALRTVGIDMYTKKGSRVTKDAILGLKKPFEPKKKKNSTTNVTKKDSQKENPLVNLLKPKKRTATEQVFLFIGNVLSLMEKEVAQFRLVHPGAEETEKKTPDLMFLSPKAVKLEKYGLKPTTFVIRVRARDFCKDVNKKAKITFGPLSRIQLILKKVKCPRGIERVQLTMQNEIADAPTKPLKCVVKGKSRIVISRVGSKQCSPVPKSKGKDNDKVVEENEPHPDVYIKLIYSVDDLNTEPKQGNYKGIVDKEKGKAGKTQTFDLPTTTTTTTTTTKKPKKKKKRKKRRKRKQSEIAASLFDIWDAKKKLLILTLLSTSILLGLWFYVKKVSRMQDLDVHEPLLLH